MAMPTEDPWSTLTAPDSVSMINARRVDAEARWNFFWARDMSNACLLVLRHSAEASPTGLLPKMKGVEVAELAGTDEDSKMLVLRLVDHMQRELFQRLCLDIMSTARAADSESEAVHLFVARTWRWHHLLRGGSDGRLSLEEQKGIIGELIVLRTLLLRHLPAMDAVGTWHGPLGAPKDFEVGRICIEAKARRGAATPYVAISSEHQLDRSSVEGLYIYVAELAQDHSGTNEGFTLTGAAERCRTELGLIDLGAVEAFEALLAATGFDWSDDYSDIRWLEGRHHIYGVTDGFPAITADMCHAGVRRVKYSIDLVECEPYRVTDADLIDAVKEGHSHAN